MAIINTNELAKIRQALATTNEVDYKRSTLNAAVQAIEDWFEADKLTLSGLIDTATSPVILTNQQKKKLAGFWMIRKAKRELL